jgi:hypothetical protein
MIVLSCTKNGPYMGLDGSLLVLQRVSTAYVLVMDVVIRTTVEGPYAHDCEFFSTINLFY